MSDTEHKTEQNTNLAREVFAAAQLLYRNCRESSENTAALDLLLENINGGDEAEDNEAGHEPDTIYPIVFHLDPETLAAMEEDAKRQDLTRDEVFTAAVTYYLNRLPDVSKKRRRPPIADNRWRGNADWIILRLRGELLQALKDESFRQVLEADAEGKHAQYAAFWTDLLYQAAIDYLRRKQKKTARAARILPKPSPEREQPKRTQEKTLVDGEDPFEDPFADEYDQVDKDIERLGMLGQDLLNCRIAIHPLKQLRDHPDPLLDPLDGKSLEFNAAVDAMIAHLEARIQPRQERTDQAWSSISDSYRQLADDREETDDPDTPKQWYEKC